MASATDIAITDAPNNKGRTPVSARPKFQDFAMLKVAEKAEAGKAAPIDYLKFHDDRKAEIWLEEEVVKARTGVSTQVVEMTPALARVLLARNPANRKISETVVENYTRDIASGAWRFNGEPVIVADNGELNDGQHRAQAVVLANRSIRVVLIIGVERETRLTLDQGKMRQTGDYLEMMGHVDAKVLAATGSFIWQWQKHGYISRTQALRPTKSEVLQFVESMPTIIGSVAAIPPKNAMVGGGRSMLAFCHWAFALTSNQPEVNAFMRSLMTGENLAGDSPILYARNRMLSDQSRLRAAEKAELIFRAWNCHRRGETPKSIPILGGDLPLVES